MPTLADRVGKLVQMLSMHHVRRDRSSLPLLCSPFAESTGVLVNAQPFMPTFLPSGSDWNHWVQLFWFNSLVPREMAVFPPSCGLNLLILAC